jgi:hypothetical protein
MTQIKASELTRSDVLLLNGTEFPVAAANVQENGMVKVMRDIWSRTTPIYLEADQYVDVKRHPRFDLADSNARRWLNASPMDFIEWLEARGWKIVPK